VSDFLSIGGIHLAEPEEVDLVPGMIFSLSISLSCRKKDYHRKVYSAFDVFASTGGLCDVIERFFALIVLFFSSRMF